MAAPAASQTRFIASFFVPGVPVQEGNIAFGKGHSYHREGKRLSVWRGAVAEAAKEAMAGAPPFEGAVRLSVLFTYEPTRRKPDPGAWKKTRPDLSKLVRAVEDALSGVCYVDDNQIADLQAAKRFGAPGEGSGLFAIVSRKL
jgi:Holliday junction resolvase RusA-like endonuclease